ncbi:hypothetical protein K1T71_011144 [Dendrolimus kikuchii]|uniref:Uncharacterized protein n=1 Tax=Dendrolimus kikuchii TaxID=765133 RepID=A0ACC1CMY9_9NEOP|nr:hypothetical protein K1T71_011144 [Dendrolimus kikuchii]
MTPTPQERVSKECDSSYDGERVVISGISGLYPKAHNVQELSSILYEKKNPINDENMRWNYNHPEVCNKTGKVPGLGYFDAQFFKVHWQQGNNMDPMSRKILEQCFQAIYDAGLSPDHLSAKKVGVYVGSCFSESEKTVFYVDLSKSGFGIAGCNKSMFANRISYWLNAKGPSMAIDQSCCSSLAALEQAYLAIKKGECEAAIVGGCHLSLHPQSSVHLARIIKLSPDGKTKSFDQNADGCAKSEAINVLFLQKAQDALRIYAEVVHVKSEFTSILKGEISPRYGFYRDPIKVANFLKEFYKQAGVSPQAIEYVEAYGSAMPEVDKVELEVIDEVFCLNRTDSLPVGSVMSNIGYSEAASGISAITKVLLGYHCGKLAGNLHFTMPRQDISALRDGKLRILDDHESFQRTYAAINAMSVTGVNAHVLLKGHYKPKDLNRYKSGIPYLVTVSGRQDTAVSRIFEDLKLRPIDAEEVALLHKIHEIRIYGHMSRGFAILGTKDNETVTLCEKIDYYDDRRRPLWFVYSGMGSQWPGMGTQLMRIPIFAAAIERCRKALEPKGIDLINIITSTDKTIFDNILHSFVGIAAVQIGLTDILKELGIVPDNIIGHSVGELGCAYADGCLTTEEMILSAYSRGLVSLQTPFIRGSMAAVGMGYSQIKNLCPAEIEVACHNGPESCTISGPADAMSEFVAQLTAKGVFAREVPCSNIAYHSRYIADAGPGLLKYLREVIKTPRLRSDRWVSTSVPQDKWHDETARYSSAEYHTNNLLSPVLFEETSRLIPANAVLVEIAPHGLLQAILKRSLSEDCRHIPLTRRGDPDNACLLLEAVGKMFMEGFNPKIYVLYPKVEFPVSTETPMLSHLIEWNHTETWPIAAYATENRKIAAICNNVISLHDVEHAYLRGHVVKNKTLYPFAGALIAAWDTLAMSLNVPKKQLSVEFEDVHFYSQPILHNQKRLKLAVQLHRGSGYFEITDGDSKVVSGYIKIFDSASMDDETHLSNVETSLNKLARSDIYDLLLLRDYNYSGEFCSIYSADVSLFEAVVEWNDNWVTLIDGLLQLHVLHRSHDSISRLTRINSICIDVNQHQKHKLCIDGKTMMNAVVSEDLHYTSRIVLDNLPLIYEKPVVLCKVKLFNAKYRDNSDCVNLTNEEVLSELIKLYPKLFSNQLGCFNKYEIDLPLKSDAKPVFMKSRPVPYALKEKINAELHRLESLGILVPVKHSDYASPIVPVLKSDGSLCDFMSRYGMPEIMVSDNGTSFASKEMSEFCKLNYIKQLFSPVYHPASNGQAESFVKIIKKGIKSILLSERKANDLHMHLCKFLFDYRNSKNSTTETSPAQLIFGHNLRSRLDLIVPHNSPSSSELSSRVDRKQSLQAEYYGGVNNKHFLVDDLVWVKEYSDWSGVYKAVTIDEKVHVFNEILLKLASFGDLNSLKWIQNKDFTGEGVDVKVHFAGINDGDVKVAAGVNPVTKQFELGYGMDFSGVTECGQRVMGLVCGGAASSRVRTPASLLWPVPEHWTLEEAATVPLAYLQALFCLTHNLTRMKLKYNCYVKQLPSRSVLIQGGAGALGQAAVSVALAFGYEVFTTVSSVSKKEFLKKLFPQLKDDNIGYSRDHSFSHMVLNNTEGKGCNVIISCTKGTLKTVTLQCCAFCGVAFDLVQIPSQEIYSFPMGLLRTGSSYLAVDVASLLDEPNSKVMKMLHSIINEGIASGFVRPLSRVCFSPAEVSRAFRLVATSNHRGRVLIKFEEPQPLEKLGLCCSKYGCHILVYNKSLIAMQLVEMLIKRGARKFHLIYNDVPGYIYNKKRSWDMSGVQVEVSSQNLFSIDCANKIFNEVGDPKSVEGVYVIAADSNKSNDKEYNVLLNNLDVISRRTCPNLKHFAVVSVAEDVGQQTYLARVKKQLPATLVYLSKSLTTDNESGDILCIKSAVDAIEKAILSKSSAVIEKSDNKPRLSLLERLASITDINMFLDADDDVYIENLLTDSTNVAAISAFLRDDYEIFLTEEQILKLSIARLKEIEKSSTETEYEDMKGLKNFYSLVDSDEMIATTELILLPTLAKGVTENENEFDVKQKYMYIIPGLEGHHERFRSTSERLKMPALVLQPGFDRPWETIQELAERCAKVIIERTEIKNNFYLFGYENGVAVALEIAAILENIGYTGTVFCVGFLPDEFKSILEEQLKEYKTEEELQDGVLRHMFGLMTKGNSSNVVEQALGNESGWGEKVEACVRALLGHVSHSAQYARSLIEAAYGRILRAREYSAQLPPLRSQLVLLRAATPASLSTRAAPLTSYSLQPLIQHQLVAPLAQVLSDLRCASIINKYLSSAILEEFKNENLCETYTVNTDIFVQSGVFTEQ